MKRNAPLFIHFFLILALSLYSGLAVTHATTPETDNSPSQPGDETPSQPGIQVESPNVTDLAHGDEDWLPVAGQTTTVTFTLKSEAGSGAAKVRVWFPETEVSSFHGICGNVRGVDPSGNDFRLLVTSNTEWTEWEESSENGLEQAVAKNDSSEPKTTEYTVVVNCYDYAAFGVLKVETYSEGMPISSRTLRLPKDANENEIADAWENEKGFYTADKTEAAKNARKDDEIGPNPRSEPDPEDPEKQIFVTGDGISVFDEYRGLKLKAGYQRLDPSRQEIFVYWKDDNATYINQGVGLATRLPGIVPYIVENEDVVVPGLHILLNQTWTLKGSETVYAIPIEEKEELEKKSKVLGTAILGPPNSKSLVTLYTKPIGESGNPEQTASDTLAHEIGHSVNLGHCPHGKSETCYMWRGMAVSGTLPCTWYTTRSIMM